MSTIHIGIIGYGLRSSVLVGACRAVGRLEITAVADSQAAAREKASWDLRGIQVFDGPDELLKSGLVDAVLIETPPDSHARLSQEALARGLHVLCDVPAVHEASEVEALWKAAGRSRAVYAFGATTNFWAFVETCADLIKQGSIGRPYYCEADYVADLGDLPSATPWRKHFPPIRYCTHSLGPVLRWIPEDLKEVACFSTGSQRNPDSGDDDAMTAIFRTPGGAVVKLLISFINSHPVPFHRYACYGTEGYFEKTQPLAGGESQVLFSTRKTYGLHNLTKLPVAEARPELQAAPGAGEHGGADVVMLQNFADTIEGKAEPSVDLRQALRMTLPGLYALESARNGGRLVEIRYPWD
jgi:predicted dehydrogenase